VNNEFERMWKEPVLVRFEVLSWNLPEGAEENSEKLKSQARLRF
jgi:hypothetical protein